MTENEVVCIAEVIKKHLLKDSIGLQSGVWEYLLNCTFLINVKVLGKGDIR